jgi:hypothetical protein
MEKIMEARRRQQQQGNQPTILDRNQKKPN